MAKKVFVPHKVDQDLSEARKKADEIVLVVDGKINPFYIAELFKTVEMAVSSIDTEVDYIAPMGSSLVNFLTGLAIGRKGSNKIKLLIFDASCSRYKEKLLELK